MPSQHQPLKELYTSSALRTPYDKLVKRITDELQLDENKGHMRDSDKTKAEHEWNIIAPDPGAGSNMAVSNVAAKLEQKLHVSHTDAIAEVRDLAKAMRDDYWKGFAYQQAWHTAAPTSSVRDEKLEIFRAISGVPARVAIDVLDGIGCSAAEEKSFVGSVIGRSVNIFSTSYSGLASRPDVHPKTSSEAMRGQSPEGMIQGIKAYYDGTVQTEAAKARS